MHIKNILSKFLFPIFLGCILTLSQSPFHYIFLSFISFFLIFNLVIKIEKPFLIGYLFGVGYFSSLLYWVGYSFAHVNLSLTLGFLCAFLLSLYLSIYSGLSFYLSYKLSNGNKDNFIKTFPFVWCFFEFIRSNFVFKGFPFGIIGYMWNDIILSVCSIGGIHFLSLLSLFCISLLCLKKVKTFVLIGAITCLLTLFEEKISETGIEMRLVQPSIINKLDPSTLEFYKILSEAGESEADDPNKPNIVIWPEAVSLADNLPVVNAKYVITGAITKTNNKIYNSVVIIKNSEYLNLYNKHHLVPFGEYIPSILKILPIQKLTYGAVDFDSGNGPKTIDLSKYSIDEIPKFSPLICYEAVFSNNVIDNTNKPTWFLNITNDMWFGCHNFKSLNFEHSTGPYQHAHISRIRSIEHGIPMVRCANNGISFVCDAYGKVLHKLELNQVGFIDFKLPKPRSNTIFNIFGNSIFFICLMIGLAKSWSRSWLWFKRD